MRLELIWQSNIVVILVNIIINLLMFSKTIVGNIPNFIDKHLLWWLIGIDVIIWLIAYNILKTISNKEDLK